MAQLADAARGDHRDRDRVGDRAGELEVVAVGGPVAVHARQQDLPRPALGRLAGPGDGLAALDQRPAAVDVDVPARRRARLASIATTTHWRAEDSASSRDQLGPRERRGVDRDLVGAGVEHRLGVVDRADAAADRERDEDVVGGAPGELDDRLAVLVRGGDVEEDELVGALGVVALGELDRVARVADVDEVGALDDPAGVDVEAGDHALERHQRLRAAPARARRRCGRSRPARACAPAAAARRARSRSGCCAAGPSTSPPARQPERSSARAAQVAAHQQRHLGDREHPEPEHALRLRRGGSPSRR